MILSQHGLPERVRFTHTERVKPVPPPISPVREVAVRYESDAPVKVKPPATVHAGGGGASPGGYGDGEGGDGGGHKPHVTGQLVLWPYVLL